MTRTARKLRSRAETNVFIKCEVLDPEEQTRKKWQFRCTKKFRDLYGGGTIDYANAKYQVNPNRMTKKPQKSLEAKVESEKKVPSNAAAVGSKNKITSLRSISP